MAFNQELAERVRACLAGISGLREQRMFGGLAFLLNGNMCCGVRQDNLVLRVGPQRYEEALTRPQVRVMDFTGRVMRGFVMVAPEGTGRPDDLRRWVQLAVSFAAELPPKPPKPSKSSSRK